MQLWLTHSANICWRPTTHQKLFEVLGRQPKTRWSPWAHKPDLLMRRQTINEARIVSESSKCHKNTEQGEGVVAVCSFRWGGLEGQSVGQHLNPDLTGEESATRATASIKVPEQEQAQCVGVLGWIHTWIATDFDSPLEHNLFLITILCKHAWSLSPVPWRLRITFYIYL